MRFKTEKCIERATKEEKEEEAGEENGIGEAWFHARNGISEPW